MLMTKIKEHSGIQLHKSGFFVCFLQTFENINACRNLTYFLPLLVPTEHFM